MLSARYNNLRLLQARAIAFTAIPALVEMLAPGGCKVTSEALGTRTAITGRLAVNENQGHLYDNVGATFQDAEQRQFVHVPHTNAKTINKGDGAQNYSFLHRLALTLLKQETTAKMGLEIKHHQASWDNNYLLTVLAAA